MTIHGFNGFTCHSRIPSTWHTGTLCYVIESNDGLVLVDTGPGTDDYKHKPAIVRVFQVLTKVPLDPEETALRQVVRLGYEPEDVHHIVLTHMHFDHCGGLPDFPHARVHVHAREYAAFTRRPHRLAELGYVRRHIAHRPELILYEGSGDRWFDFDAIRLPFEPEMALIPLFGHSPGHCGVAIRTESGWLLHAGDAAPIGLGNYAPRWLVRLALGPHTPRLRQFARDHPGIPVTTGHMWLDFFQADRPSASPTT